MNPKEYLSQALQDTLLAAVKAKIGGKYNDNRTTSRN